MSLRYNHSRSKQNSTRENSRLAFEHLESRLMNAIDTIDYNLDLLNSQGTVGSNPAVSVVSNTAPSISTPLRLTGGTQVTGRTASVSALGTDDKGETNLRYNWQALSVPAGGSVSFAVTNTNAAKNNTLSFNKPGTYEVRVSIQDQEGLSTTSNLRFNVVQTFTSLRVTTPSGSVVSSGTSISSTGATQRLNVVGLDQFGMSMTKQPNVFWRTISSPTGGTATLTRDGNSLSARFSQLGTYFVQAQSGNAVFNVGISVGQTLSSLSLLTNDTPINASQAVTVIGSSQRFAIRGLDQFGKPMTTLPTITFTATTVPVGGSVTTAFSNGAATIAFSKLGTYAIRAQTGNAKFEVTVNVVPTLSSIVVQTPENRPLAASGSLTVERTSQRLIAVGRDQFGQPLASQPAISWSLATVPGGAAATISVSGHGANATLNRAGTYTVRASAGNRVQNVTLNVVQTLSGITVTPSTATIATGAQQQYRIQAVDQFQRTITTQPTVTWSATGGTITSAGLFTAGAAAGSFAITARVGTFTNTAAVQVTAPTPTPAPNQSTLRDSALASLITRLYTDNQLSRLEMIQILRSAGNDGTVDSTELTDLRTILSSNSYAMPSHVRELAHDVVNGNVANQKFKGQNAGNLAAGSSSTLLNNLVDKWFLGADEPALTTSSLSYQTATGSLFSTTPSRADAKQGMLGNCYFIAALASIADKNADAVRNMFIDNGDSTFTVRFYGSSTSGVRTADYVTVNRRLPAYSNGALGYSSYGMSILSATTPLWIAFAEKAYAQWNETGQAGRDGTNRYAAIEGGWMSNVNAQVLGYNSSNYWFSSTSKQTLIDALNSSKAITLGTQQSASAGGLVGSHAYTITGYNAATDTFSLHNPWGVSHPTPLTWSQLQANCSMFVVADATASVAINQASVRAQVSEALIGNWTIETPTLASLNATPEETALVFGWEASLTLTSDDYETQGPVNSMVSVGELVATQSSIDESSPEEQIHFALNADLVDLAMASVKVSCLL